MEHIFIGICLGGLIACGLALQIFYRETELTGIRVQLYGSIIMFCIIGGAIAFLTKRLI